MFFSSVGVVHVQARAPVITDHPEDEEVVVPGSFATFFCEADGTLPLTFTWWRRQTSSGSGAPNGNPEMISEADADGNHHVVTIIFSIGSNTGLLAFLEPPPSYAGWEYYCVVSNEDGSVTSDAAALTIFCKLL